MSTEAVESDSAPCRIAATSGSPAGRSSGDDGDLDLPLDTVFDMLSAERRRHTLEYLLEEEERTTLSDLAEHVASVETGKPETELGSKERSRVYISLYQGHLPRMDDAGVIAFEPDRKTIELDSNAHQLRPHLDLGKEVRSRDGSPRSWGRYYLGVTLVGCLLLVVQTAVLSIGWLSTVLQGGLLLVYLGLSLVHESVPSATGPAGYVR